MDTFLDELAALINRYSQENLSDTPDFILAGFLEDCLNAFDTAINHRSAWYGHHDYPGQSKGPVDPAAPVSDRAAIRSGQTLKAVTGRISSSFPFDPEKK